MELAVRVTELRNKAGLSIDELVEKSGVPKGTVSKICSGHALNPTLETMRAIAKALGCTLDDFVDSGEYHMEYKSKRALAYERAEPRIKQIVDLTLEPYMSVAAKHNKSELLTQDPPEPEITPMKSIRLYLTPAAAGIPNPFAGDDYVMIDVPEDSQADFAVPVRGNSAEPLLNNGDKAYISAGSEPLDGEMWLFMLDGEPLIKIYHTDGEHTYLVSYNRLASETDRTLWHSDTREYGLKPLGKVILPNKINQRR
jgi:transcriptional regulator with XRE-family HTH domain